MHERPQEEFMSRCFDDQNVIPEYKKFAFILLRKPKFIQ